MALRGLSGPNLENYLYQLTNHRDDRRNDIIVANSVLFPLATVSVVMRLWARRRHGGRWTSDDYLIVIAMVSELNHSTRGSGTHLGSVLWLWTVCGWVAWYEQFSLNGMSGAHG